jgi:serine/threonine protein kinase
MTFVPAVLSQIINDEKRSRSKHPGTDTAAWNARVRRWTHEMTSAIKVQRGSVRHVGTASPCPVMQFLHECEFTHRDLKPVNIGVSAADEIKVVWQ